MCLEGAPPVGDGHAVVDRGQLFHFCELKKEMAFTLKFIHSKPKTTGTGVGGGESWERNVHYMANQPKQQFIVAAH